MTAAEILDREFLEIRARILKVAASLDRLERAPGNVAEDARVKKLREALAVLLETGADRAEQIQLAMSLPYEEGWRKRNDL
jgi:hypothetical protein